MSSTVRWANLTVALCIFILAGTLATAIGGESASNEKALKFDKKDLPLAVVAAFEKAYPKGNITGAEKESKDSVQYYEIESKEGKTERSILYTADGAVFEIEEVIPANALPASVAASIAIDAPKGKIKKAERTTRGTVVEYEVEISAGGHEVVMLLDSNGKVLRTEKLVEDEDEDEGDEKDED